MKIENVNNNCTYKYNCKTRAQMTKPDKPPPPSLSLLQSYQTAMPSAPVIKIDFNVINGTYINRVPQNSKFPKIF